MNDIPETADVVIVGAGPTGLSLAIALRQLELEPVLLEARVEAAHTSRAAVIHARTLEMVEPLGVTPALLAHGIRVPIFRVRDRDKILMEVDFSGLDTRYPFTLMCPQDRTEAILRDRLAAVGGRIIADAKVDGLIAAGETNAVSLRSGGKAKTIAAKWVIGCDGAHSAVRAAAGIDFPGKGYDQVFALADVKMRLPLPRDEVSLFCSPAGLVVIAPLPGDHWRIVATVDQAPEEPDASFVQKLLVERGPSDAHPLIETIVWSSRFHVAHRVADRFVSGRVILCGDAAHVHSPAGGQGMNTGIQDGVSLAPALKASLEAGAETPALADWARARRAIAENVVSITDRMTRAATIQSETGRLARNAMLAIAGHLPGVPDMIAKKLSELDRR